MAIDLSPFIKPAQELEEKTGIPTAVTLAQITLESSGAYSGGLSGLAATAKNLFGIKGTGTAGSTKQNTKEVVGGKTISVNAGFRAYNSFSDSIADYGKLLSSSRYASNLKSATDLQSFIQGIKNGGYATDPAYVSKVMGIINSKNLAQHNVNKTVSFKGDPSVKIDTQAGASSSGGASSSNGDTTGSMIQKIFKQGVRVILFITIFILAIIFFMRAFPAVEDVASNVTPVGKVTKISKKVLKK